MLQYIFKTCDTTMGGKKSAIVELYEQLEVLVEYGALCVCKDIDLIVAHLQEALEKDQEERGHGIRREPWSLDTFEVPEIDSLFRFKTKDDIRYLMDSLDFPPDEYWMTPSGTRFTREEAMTFYLRRMAYPTKLRLVHREGFKAQIGALSELYTMVSDWLFENHTHRLLQTGLTKWAHRVPGYALAIQAYTGIPWQCFGFIDGTSRGVAKPGFWQREFYSGHKRHHCLQFLSITGPDGMILFTYGPANGAHQDNWSLNESQLVSFKLPHLCEILGDHYFVYGDPIFARSEYVQKAFPAIERTWRQHLFNKAMNAARVSIEHIFGRVVTLWAHIDFRKQQKLFHTNPGRAYLNAQFLTNCYTCMYSNQTTKQFKHRPPTLHLGRAAATQTKMNIISNKISPAVTYDCGRRVRRNLQYKAHE